MQITVVSLIRSKKKVSPGRVGCGGRRQDDGPVNVNRKSPVCAQLKGSGNLCSRIKILDPALKLLKGEMMPLAVEACSPWLGIKRAFLQHTKALRE